MLRSWSVAVLSFEPTGGARRSSRSDGHGTDIIFRFFSRSSESNFCRSLRHSLAQRDDEAALAHRSDDPLRSQQTISTLLLCR